MPNVIDCPGCGAPLDVPPNARTTRCRYCGQAIELSSARAGSGPTASVVVIRPGSGRAAHWAGWTTCLVIGIAAAAVLVGAVAALVAGGLGAGLAFLQPDSPPGAPREILQPTATEIPSFGGDGIGPGLFTDARSIDVDGQGRIYVGEYQGGRVQVFTPDGTFLTQWHAARDLPLRGLAVTRGGDVILAQGGELMRYNGESGERLGPVTSAAEGFDDIAVTPDGQLLASSTSAGEDALVVLSRDGNPLRVIPNAVSGQTGDSELDVRVAADGQGNLLGLGTFNETVVVFSPEGRYLNRVGSAGDETGQLRAPSSIEVDGRGRIYVGDVDGVEVFHPDGRHLTTLEVDGFPFGLAFAQDGRLLVVNGSRVAWLDVPG